jgi:hypothetical protein
MRPPSKFPTTRSKSYSYTNESANACVSPRNSLLISCSISDSPPGHLSMCSSFKFDDGAGLSIMETSPMRKHATQFLIISRRIGLFATAERTGFDGIWLEHRLQPVILELASLSAGGSCPEARGVQPTVLESEQAL